MDSILKRTLKAIEDRIGFAKWKPLAYAVDEERQRKGVIPACACGRRISANKKACRECASVPFVNALEL